MLQQGYGEEEPQEDEFRVGGLWLRVSFFCLVMCFAAAPQHELLTAFPIHGGRAVPHYSLSWESPLNFYSAILSRRDL